MANPQIEVEIGAKIKSLFDSLNDAEGALQKFAGKAQKIGTALSLAITTPLLAIAGISISNFDKQAQAIGQIESALKSTGGTAGLTSKELQKIASELQNISVFGDEEILQKSTAQLLTFTNIAGEQFKKTQKAALDLATRLGGDLQGATIQLGKALNDPVEGLSALGRSGIQFSKDQKELIKSLAETNRLAEAQDLILSELEKQYGGAAEAAAQLGLGPLRQLQNQFGDLLEDVGKILIEGFLPLVNFGQKVITFFQGLSDETKKAIVVISGIAAAIGPLLVAVGTAIKLIPLLTTGFVALKAAVIAATGPFGLIALAIAAAVPLLINLNNELNKTSKIAGLVKADLLAESLKQSREEFERLSKSFESTGLKPLEAQNKAIDALLLAELNLLKARQEGKKNIDFDAIKARVAALNELKAEINKVSESEGNLSAATKQTLEEFSKLQDIANEKIFRQFAEEANAFNKELDETIRILKSFEESAERLAKIKTAQQFGNFQELGVNLGDGPPISETADELPSGGGAFNFEFKEAFDKLKEEFSAFSGDFIGTVVEFTRNIKNIIQQNLGEAFVGIGEALGTALATGTSVVKALGQSLLSSIANFLGDLGQQLIAFGVAGIAFGSLIEAIKKGGPLSIPAGIAAIGAGVALVAASAAIRSTASKGLSGGGAGVGTSGVGAGSSFTGTGGTGFSADRNINLVGSFRIAGSDLLYVIDQSNQARI
jgi:hypothetical protein